MTYKEKLAQLVDSPQFRPHQVTLRRLKEITDKGIGLYNEEIAFIENLYTRKESNGQVE